MSIRLQVVMGEDEVAEIRQRAKAQHQTVSEWVRQALRVARREYPAVEAESKIQVIRESLRHGYPTSDIADMLREIERGGSEEESS